MRAAAVEVGQTYLVHVPQRDNPLRYVTRDRVRFNSVDRPLYHLAISRWDNDFELTVTEAGGRLGDEPAVTGVRVTEGSRIQLPLPVQYAERLGLPPSVAYEVDGVLRDAETGKVVEVPVDQTLTVPTRWLHPLP